MLRMLADVAKAVGKIPSANEVVFKLRFTPAHKRNIDPVGEAEVYLFYQQYAKAEHVLQKALQNQPDNLDAKLLLLQIHVRTGATQAYCDLAGQLQSEIIHTRYWQQVCKDGHALAPDHPLFSRQFDMLGSTTRH